MPIRSLALYRLLAVLMMVCLATGCTTKKTTDLGGRESSGAGGAGLTGGGQNGESFGGDDLLRDIIVGIREDLPVAVDAVLAANDPTGVCKIQCPDANNSFCQNALLLNPTQEQECATFLYENASKLKAALLNSEISIRVLMDPIYVNAIEVIARTALSPTGAIEFNFRRAENLTRYMLATVLTHELLHKIPDTSGGFTQDEAEYGSFSRGHLLLTAAGQALAYHLRALDLDEGLDPEGATLGVDGGLVVGMGEFMPADVKTKDVVVRNMGRTNITLREISAAEAPLTLLPGSTCVADLVLEPDRTCLLKASVAPTTPGLLNVKAIKVDYETAGSAKFIKIGFSGNLREPIIVSGVRSSIARLFFHKALSGQTYQAAGEMLTPLGNLNSDVYVATGDLNGDNTEEVIASAGPGQLSTVTSFRGLDGLPFADSFLAYGTVFAGGAFVTSGDTNNDGTDEIITGAGAGGGPHVKIMNGTTHATLFSFFAFDRPPQNPKFAGGVRVASGDVNRDGHDDIICGAGTGGGPHVEVYSGLDGSFIYGFFAFSHTFTGGIYVASTDVNHDGYDDIIVSQGAGGTGEVKIFSGVDAAQMGSSFYPYGNGFARAIRLAAAIIDEVEGGDIVTSTVIVNGEKHNIKVFNGTSHLEISDKKMDIGANVSPANIAVFYH